MTDPDHYEGVGQQVDDAASEIAKAALGIPADAQLKTLNVSDAALFVHYSRDGWMTANASIPKREAAKVLRQVADMWDQEWKTAEHAERQARREGRNS